VRVVGGNLNTSVSREKSVLAHMGDGGGKELEEKSTEEGRKE